MSKKWSGKQAEPSCPECRVELEIAGHLDWWLCPKCGKEWRQAGMRLEEIPPPQDHGGITSLADMVHRELSAALNSPELQAAREHVGLKPTVPDEEIWEAMNGARELVGLGPMEGIAYDPLKDTESRSHCYPEQCPVGCGTTLARVSEPGKEIVWRCPECTWSGTDQDRLEYLGSEVEDAVVERLHHSGAQVETVRLSRSGAQVPIQEHGYCPECGTGMNRDKSPRGWECKCGWTGGTPLAYQVSFPVDGVDFGMKYAPQEDKEIPVARVGLGDDGTVTLEASKMTLGSPDGEPVVNVPLAMDVAQAARVAQGGKGGLVGHVVLGDGVVLPVIIPGMELGIMSPMTPYTPLQASIVKVRDDGGADVNWESVDHLVGYAKDHDTLELHTHSRGGEPLSFEDVKDVAVRIVEEMDQATRDKLYLTHDGQPCPGTCVTLATELEDARAELREAKSGKVDCQVCGDNGSNGLCPACGRFQTPDTAAQVRERLVKTVGRLYEENGRLRDQLYPPPGKPVLDGELDPYTLVDSVLRNGCPECGKPVMIEAQVPEGGIDFAWAFTCAGLGRGIGTCGWWAISVVSLADAARVALRHPAATKEDSDDQAGDEHHDAPGPDSD